ncbi:hypothetical protein ACLRDC_20260 [Gluconacetobacter sacchari]|uniref:hypothetical protein n=1 Tax=Gluconacetobacter sacchari TaxID=92759 RepID=UPI0039B619B6
MVQTAFAEGAAPVSPAGFGVFQPFSNDPGFTLNAAFAPDGGTVYFSKSQPTWDGLTIFSATRQHGSWSAPQVAPFSGADKDTDPAVSPDGAYVLFASIRPETGAAYRLYRYDFRTHLTTLALPEPASTTDNDLYPSFTHSGVLYFMRMNAAGTTIYGAAPAGRGFAVPSPVVIPGGNKTTRDMDPTIAPDESFIVFASNRPGTLGAKDLFIAFHTPSSWCAPLHFDAPINSPGNEVATGLSPDGQTLYFASARSDVTNPRAKPIDSAAFQKEQAAYANGLLRPYKVSIAAFIAAHRPLTGSCSTAQ